jgi:hypothetical protein
MSAAKEILGRFNGPQERQKWRTGNPSYWQWFYARQGLKGSAWRFNAGNLLIPTTRPRASSQNLHAHSSEAVLLTTAFNDFPTVACDLPRMGVSKARRSEQVRVHCSTFAL